MTTKERVKKAIEHPLSWFAAGVASVLSVFGAIAFDPTGSVAAIIALGFDVSTTIFGALSIAAFTLAPNLDSVPLWLEDLLVVLAIIFGILAFLKIMTGVWDRLKKVVLE